MSFEGLLMVSLGTEALLLVVVAVERLISRRNQPAPGADAAATEAAAQRW